MSVSLKFFTLASLAGQLKRVFFIFEQSNPKPSFLLIKQDFSYLFNYLCNISIFAFYIAWYDKRMEGCYSLNDHGNLTVDHWIYHGKIMEFYFLFSIGTLISANIDPGRRYLYFYIKTGKAFLEHIDMDDGIPGQVASYFTFHIHFRGQRFKSRPIACACEPDIDEGFLLELHKEGAGNHVNC